MSARKRKLGQIQSSPRSPAKTQDATTPELSLSSRASEKRHRIRLSSLLLELDCWGPMIRGAGTCNPAPGEPPHKGLCGCGTWPILNQVRVPPIAGRIRCPAPATRHPTHLPIERYASSDRQSAAAGAACGDPRSFFGGVLSAARPDVLPPQSSRILRGRDALPSPWHCRHASPGGSRSAPSGAGLRFQVMLR